MADHQPSPVTPEGSALGGGGPGAAPGISPQISVTGPARQDSQLSSTGGGGSGQGLEQQQQQQQDAASQQYSRQNSAVPPGVKGDASQPPSQEDRSRVSPLHVESILGIKDNQPIDPPLGNSLREGGGGGGGGVGSNVSSPHTQSPHGDAAGGGSGGGGGNGAMLVPGGVAAAGGQDRQSPAPGPGRPELLGFPAKSPSFRGQPSPLAEESKSVSACLQWLVHGEA